jgi:hypothetical protein
VLNVPPKAIVVSSEKGSELREPLTVMPTAPAGPEPARQLISKSATLG